MVEMASDWFTKLVGFEEESYAATRSRLLVEGDELVSAVNGKRYGIGSLSVPTLAELCSHIDVPDRGRTTVRCVTGDPRAMHAEPELVLGQIGTPIALGLRFDTLIVRSFMTPSIAALLGRWFWWPVQVRQRPAPSKFASDDPRQLALF
jgi:hypothetical protein